MNTTLHPHVSLSADESGSLRLAGLREGACVAYFSPVNSLVAYDKQDMSNEEFRARNTRSSQERPNRECNPGGGDITHNNGLFQHFLEGPIAP